MVPEDCIAFIRFISDAMIVSERDPSALPDFFKPFLVGCIWRKMIVVTFDF